MPSVDIANGRDGLVSGWCGRDDVPGRVLLEGSSWLARPVGGRQEAAGAVRFNILGPLEVLGGQRLVELGRPKQRALLAVLLVHANQVVALDQLIEELWGEEPPAQATASLQAYVSNLRRVLEPDRPARTLPRVLVTQPPGYRLVVAPEELDAARFVVLAEQGHRLAEAGQPDVAGRVLREALGLWRGPALAEVADEPFAQAERQRLEELRLVALEDRLACELALGEHATAAAELGELVGRYPFRERLHGLLMLALYRSGRQAEALRAFRAAHHMLGEELGIDPSRWLRELEAGILRQAPALDWTAPPGQVGQPAQVETARPATTPPPPAGDGELGGRDGQLAVLDAALTGAAAGRGRVVLVAGEPGIGKTRLAEEVARRATAQGIQVVWGRCYEGEGAPALWPWVQVGRGLVAGVAPGELGGVLGRSGAALSQLLPELQELVPGLEPPPVVELETARFRLYQAVAGLLRRLAEVRPLLVIVDDLHWADVASLRLLVFLAAELRAARLVVVGTYRDVEAGTGQPLAETLGALAREPVVERIALGGLGTAEVARLIANAVGTRPVERLVRTVHDRTGGNPFFVTELLRLLQSEGELQADHALAAARRAIPVGVRDVLQRRLARLPEQTNAVLLVGAVAGRAFDLDLVEAVTRLDDERALEAVEAAVIAGLLVEDEQMVGRYRFSHGLVRETIYQQLSRARRVRLHARVAQALVALHEPDDPEHVLELAQHAWTAVPVTGAEAALPYVLAAADHAMTRLAYEQAEQQLRRALELLGSMPPSAQRTRWELGVQVQLGNLLGQLGSPGAPEAASVFARAAELAAEVADDPAALPALAGVHAGHTTRADHDHARALAERVLAGARRSGDPQARLAGHFLLGHTLCFQGELAAAREHLEEAVRLAEAMPEASLPPGTPLALTAAGLLENVLVLLGQHDQAARVAEAASRDIERSHHPYPKAMAMTVGVYAAAQRRDPSQLRQRAAAAAALSERWGFQMLAASATAPLGWAQAVEGDPAGGAALLRQALARLEATGAQATRPLLLGLLAEAERLAGRPDQALRLLDNALAQINESGERSWEAELHRLRGESLLAVSPPRPTEAETAFRTSIEVARRQGAKLLEGRTSASLGRLLAAQRSQSSR
jgi:DNA-binding SARP family transcriptional activator